MLVHSLKKSELSHHLLNFNPLFYVKERPHCEIILNKNKLSRLPLVPYITICSLLSCQHKEAMVSRRDLSVPDAARVPMTTWQRLLQNLVILFFID